MRQKLLLLTLFLLVLGYFGITWNMQSGGSFSIENMFTLSHTASPESEARPIVATAAPQSAFDPTQLHGILYDPYRLKIDSRFLFAIEEIMRVITEQAEGSATATFRDNKWFIQYDNKDIGVVPERPDFSDFFSILTDWARTTTTTQSFTAATSSLDLTDSEIHRLSDSFLAKDTAAALRLIDQKWRAGSRQIELLELAARGLVNLTVQQLDTIEVGDRLPAKALATLAMARLFNPEALVPEEVLLAYSMGYSAHARKRAQLLSKTDPVRLFVLHEDHALYVAAGQPSASRQSRYLWLLRQHGCGCGDLKTYFAWINKYFSHDAYSLPIVKTALDLHDFSLGPQLAEALSSLALLTLARDIDMPGLPDSLKKFDRQSYSDEDLNTIITAVTAMLTSKREVLLGRFESGLSILDQDYKGPFLDARTYGAFYSGYFFSGLYTLGIHYLDKLSLDSAVNNLAASLGSPSSGAAKDFSLWYRHLAELHQGHKDGAILAHDLQELKLLGAPPFVRSYNEIRKRSWAAKPGETQPIKAMMLHLDSRPEHRYELGQMAYSDLLDISLSDKAYSSVVETDPAHFEDFTAWYLHFAGEDHRLLALLDDTMVSDRAKLNALTLLTTSNNVTATFIESHYAQMMKRQPRDWNVASEYIKFLQETKQYVKGRTVASQWLKEKVVNGSLAPVVAKADIAWMYYLEGRYKEAWDTIRPVVDSWQGTVLYRACLILDKLNQPIEAEQMGRAFIERYPGETKGRGMVAQLFWKHNKPQEAAEILNRSPVTITLYEWEHDIGPLFEEAFEEQSIDSAREALAALQRAGINEFSLYRLTFVPARHGKHEFAYAILSQLRSNPSFFLYAYSHHKAWEGKEEALTILHQHIPVSQFGPASNVMYDSGQYDLLWDFSDQIDLKVLGDYVWVLRAATQAEPGMPSKERRQALLSYYSQHPSGHYNTLGRYLMGLATEEEVLREATSSSTIASTSYYLGVKAKSEGRYVDASDWFRFGAEKGSSQEPEHKWCFDALMRWRQLKHNLDYIAAAQL